MVFLRERLLDARTPVLPSLYSAHGPKGGMSLDGLSGKSGARFSKNDLMPSWASAPAARWPTQATSSVTASSGFSPPHMLHISRRLTAVATADEVFAANLR